VDDDISIADPDPLVSTMQLSKVPAEVASQHRPLDEASPLIVPARTPIGDDPASPLIDNTIPIVSQLGSLDSPSLKRIKISGTFSDATSESFPSIMLSHLNSLVSQFESFGDADPFSDHSTESIDFAAMQSLIDSTKGILHSMAYQLTAFSIATILWHLQQAPRTILIFFPRARCSKLTTKQNFLNVRFRRSKVYVTQTCLSFARCLGFLLVLAFLTQSGPIVASAAPMEYF
jgi:hypothetical protein